MEQSSDAEVVNHVEQSEFRGIRKGCINREAPRQLLIEEIQVIHQKCVNHSVRQQGRIPRPVKSGGFRRRQRRDAVEFGENGVRSCGLTGGIDEAEGLGASGIRKHFADADGH